jgi:hypothetical protein
VNGGTQAHVYTKSQSQTDSLMRVLKKHAKHFTIVARKQFPKAWHYDNPRSGDLLVIANPGKYLIAGGKDDHQRESNKGSTFGVHGYDPQKVKDMYGIFYARGPQIKKGKKIPAFQNIHVYPFIARLLNVKTSRIDGSEAVLAPLLR